MHDAVLHNITQQAEMLTMLEYLELIERLARRLREKRQIVPQTYHWQELYGLGKGLWADEDAQDYVNRLREDRV